MGKRVLIADDSRTIRDMVEYTLKGIGLAVATAENGAKALALAKGGPFDLVITDVNMPEMDGLALVRSLRALPGYRSVPVLVLTTEADQKKKDEGRAAGATGWIVKPFVPEKLVAVVQKVVG